MDSHRRLRLWLAVAFLTALVAVALAVPADRGTATATPADGTSNGLEALRLAPEGPRHGYSRSLFPHWGDADGDGCNTREEVLMAESASPAQVDPQGCRVLSGEWFSPYDGVSVTAPSRLEVDHVVALAEAWDSGASTWTAQRREAFANDLTEPAALHAVTSAANQAKSDHDPAGWTPRRDDWCRFATAWITVKAKWDLAADQPEVDALREMLAAC